MLTLNTRINSADKVSAQLVLPYESRENSRLRTALSSGEEVAIFIPRGTVLRNNDLLMGDDGRVVQIVAARESTYRITCANPHDLLRCAFHLGNRHTQTQVGEGFLRIARDNVLKEMLEGLGATVIEEDAQFEPEAGAYGSGGHHHHHGESSQGHAHGPLAPIPVHQKIHRPSDIPSR